MEAGLLSDDPMGGRRALSWAEIQAYASLTREISEPWEARWIREASIAYLDELARGANHLGIMPIEREGATCL